MPEKGVRIQHNIATKTAVFVEQFRPMGRPGHGFLKRTVSSQQGPLHSELDCCDAGCAARGCFEVILRSSEGAFMNRKRRFEISSMDVFW